MKCDTCKNRKLDYCKIHKVGLSLIDVNACNDYDPKPSQVFKVRKNGI